MKRLISLIIGLGIGVQLHADPLVLDTKFDRKHRVFRTDANGLITIDLIVAYQDIPTYKPTAASTPIAVPDLGTNTVEAFLTKTFQDASLNLFKATNGAAKLGKVTIIPFSGSVDPLTGKMTAPPKADPDIVILADQIKSTSPLTLACPDGIQSLENGTCADANTGGYLGLAWWLPATTVGTGTAAQPAYQTTGVTSEGSRIAVGWSTLKDKGGMVLLHEFGHYLFGMRDEYEGIIFPSPAAYTAAVATDNPVATFGNAFKTGKPAKPSDATLFNGYAMGLLSAYPDPDKATVKFSPPELKRTDAKRPEWLAFPDDEDQHFVVEQIASEATRGTEAVRNGGLWSFAAAVRTSLKTPWTPPDLGTTTHTNPTVEFYGSDQVNIFILDASGSMMDPVRNGPAGLTKWDAAVDFFGRLTHSADFDAAGSKAKFALLTFGFSTNFATGGQAITDALTSLDGAGNVDGTHQGIRKYTVPRTSSSPAGVEYIAATSPSIPGLNYRNWTNLKGAIDDAKTILDGLNPKPYQPNVIVISDGNHNYPQGTAVDVTAGAGKYRIFAVSVDADLSTDQYGQMLYQLATNSVGPEGVKGEACASLGSSTTASLTLDADRFVRTINYMDGQSFKPSNLFADAVQDYPAKVDAGQTQGKFSISWSGPNAPIVKLVGPKNQDFLEQNYYGIKFTKSVGIKTFDVDFTKFPMEVVGAANNWKLQVRQTSGQTIPVFASIFTKSAALSVNLTYDATALYSTGRLPITVVVQDGRPIEGLQVNAVLENRVTGVKLSIPLKWNGAAYTGVQAGFLQPGLNDLTVSVVYPTTGKVYRALGENRIPDAQRTVYPYFADRMVSKQVWVASQASPLTVPGLDAMMINLEPNNGQGTTMKMYLANNTALTFKDLKVRYFFSLSEFANGAPGFNTNYLPQSKVTYGTVANRPGLAYVQFDFAGKTLLPNTVSSNGTNGGEYGVVIDSRWQRPWNTSNDYSAQGLKTTWAANKFVNIYDGTGKLISGSADLDAPTNSIPDAQPLVSLVPGQDLVVAGVGAQFSANAIDPEGMLPDQLKYTWKVDGVTVTSVTSQLVYTFATAGTHVVSVTVADTISAPVTVTKQVVVQTASGACTDASTNLGLNNANKIVSLVAGTNCFVIRDDAMVREWKWSKVQFQANSDNGVALTGLSASVVPAGTATSLSGYSQTVPFADPGVQKRLYIKINATTARTVRLNWWLQ